MAPWVRKFFIEQLPKRLFMKVPSQSDESTATTAAKNSIQVRRSRISTPKMNIYGWWHVSTSSWIRQIRSLSYLFFGLLIRPVFFGLHTEENFLWWKFTLYYDEMYVRTSSEKKVWMHTTVYDTASSGLILFDPTSSQESWRKSMKWWREFTFPLPIWSWADAGSLARRITEKFTLNVQK